jgi:hypothetical protein
MKQEIKNLVKIGINEEMATLVAAAKYGNIELASEIVSSIADENQALMEILEEFKPYQPEDTTGYILTKSEDENTIEILDDNIILSSTPIEESNAENQNESV